MAITISDSAAERVRTLKKKRQTPEAILRVGVRGGGCSGLQYQLSFDDAVDEADHEIAAFGVRVIVDEKSALYLVGSTLDFVDSLQESGFKIENPNASNSCGCGQSFAA